MGLFCHAYHERLRFVLVIIGVGQTLHGDAAVNYLMAFVNKINSVYLNVYPDIGNITNAAKTYGTDVLEDLKTGAGHVVAMHLKETVPGVFREVPFGTGHVDFQAAIKTAWEIGIRKFVTEFWYTGNPQWKSDLQYANQMMTGILVKQA